ncbi:acetylornithine deacetylase [Pseudoalteromonas sp. Cnat2-41]|uniref:acetylornithine deacetylase n=1 Tax=unclassified Pseudoalteromonas TaxID=194690 RepID=UPI001EF7AD08|nr:MULTISPECIES: acetylornithine deacetylase [unclassified Pseudoalteromonas]MCF2862808.1 acetylornithine deacetylase [Pseudoalteromonas sp. CNAT2-18]MCG7558740.1 acetylornithine deacetylase [Pseudoalteromonas sp. CNAT2-18.1]
MALPDFLHLYRELIATPSISSLDPKLSQSNRAVIEHLASWCEELGFACEIKPLSTDADKFNLIAKRGHGIGGLMLAGHTDTVPFDQGRWSMDPFTLSERDNKLFGLGSIDMKGFFAFVLNAIAELDASKQQQPLLILATADEETTMAGAQEVAKYPDLKPARCVIGEPTDMTPVFTHKGHMTSAIRIVGKSGHSSDPERGINAIEVMHLVIQKLLVLKEDLKNKYSIEHFAIPYPTLNLGHIHGGDNANRICGCCELQLDMRPLPGLSIVELQAMLLAATQDITARYPGCVEVIDMHDPIPAFAGTTDSALVQLAQKISQQPAIAVNYCTEAPFIQQLGCETIVMGPGSINQAHQPNEFLAMDRIAPSQRIIKELIQQSCW